MFGTLQSNTGSTANSPNAGGRHVQESFWSFRPLSPSKWRYQFSADPIEMSPAMAMVMAMTIAMVMDDAMPLAFLQHARSAQLAC